MDVNSRDTSGRPILWVFGRYGAFPLTEALIAAGADVNARTAHGSTLLLDAIAVALTETPYTTLIDTLLQAGADPDAGRVLGRNPLALARAVPHDPGIRNGGRWIAKSLERAGAVAEEDADAPPIVPEAPLPLPPWKARIQADLARAASYVVLGVRLTPGPIAAAVTAVPNALPRWCGLGADDIALYRAKLEFLVGPPPTRGDAYKITFEYELTATVDGRSVCLRVCDWKAAEMSVGVETQADPEARERALAALVELLMIAPLARFRDKFRFDAESGRAYHCDGSTAFAEFRRR